MFNSVSATGALLLLPLAFILGLAPGTRALELLTVHELATNCEHLQSEPDGPDGQYCIRHIQGFIDGAVKTDERIVQDLAAAANGASSLTERAKRTRMPRRGAYDQPGSLAGFCLGDPLPLRQVVDMVVSDLGALDMGATAASTARVAVDDSLRRHYPCTE